MSILRGTPHVLIPALTGLSLTPHQLKASLYDRKIFNDVRGSFGTGFFASIHMGLALSANVTAHWAMTQRQDVFWVNDGGATEHMMQDRAA